MRSRGESQDLEYKELFPENVRDLGKEIAAFASSNSGKILIGIADSGDLIGLPDCVSAEGRDQMIRRIEGLSRSTVKPSITPTVKFAVEGKAVVLVVTVPRGAQPVYYSSNTPYLRHLTEARPAEPHEVIEKIREYLDKASESNIDTAANDKSEIYSRLARILAEVLVFVAESEERTVKPWLDLLRSVFGSAATELRDMVASQQVIDEGIDIELKNLIGRLDSLTSRRLHFGVSGDLKRSYKEIGDLASGLMMRHILSKPLSEASIRQVRNRIHSISRKLMDLSVRSKEMVEAGGIKKLQSEASGLGYELAHLSHYNIDPLGDDVKAKLGAVGQLLHLTETMRLHLDGGMSMKAIVDRIQHCSEELQVITSKLGM